MKEIEESQHKRTRLLPRCGLSDREALHRKGKKKYASEEEQGNKGREEGKI